MAIGAALAAMRNEARLTQEALAEALEVDQRTVSRLEAGDQRIYLDQMLAFEQACGKPAGWALRLAGISQEPQTVQAAIEADVRLTNGWRTMVVTTYRTAVASSARDRKASSPKRAPTSSSRRKS